MTDRVRLSIITAALVIGVVNECVHAARAGPVSFRAAKRAAREIYADRRVTFYCGCTYDERGVIDADSCGYVPRRDTQRAQRVEWEHVVPAHVLGAHRPCWAEGGREHCARVDPEYRRAEADLINLVPAIGELNAIRSNHPYGEIPGEPRRFGHCDFEDDGQATEPAAHLRGDVARIHLEMARRYGLEFSDAEWWRLIEWASSDPIDDWERERRTRVFEAQGENDG